MNIENQDSLDVIDVIAEPLSITGDTTIDGDLEVTGTITANLTIPVQSVNEITNLDNPNILISAPIDMNNNSITSVNDIQVSSISKNTADFAVLISDDFDFRGSIYNDDTGIIDVQSTLNLNSNSLIANTIKTGNIQSVSGNQYVIIDDLNNAFVFQNGKRVAFNDAYEMKSITEVGITTPTSPNSFVLFNNADQGNALWRLNQNGTTFSYDDPYSNDLTTSGTPTHSGLILSSLTRDLNTVKSLSLDGSNNVKYRTIYYNYNESLSTSTSADTVNWSNKVTLNVTIPETSLYFVGFACIAGSTIKNDTNELRLTEDTVAINTTSMNTPANNNNGELACYNMQWVRNLTAGAHTFTLDFRPVIGTGVIADARIYLFTV